MMLPLGPFAARFGLVISMAFLLPSCGGSEDSAKTKENRKKSEILKTEADELAADAAMIQTKIREYGSSDTTSAKIVETLLIEEKRVQGEAARLTQIAADLQSANEILAQEKDTFKQKYPQP